MICRSCGHVNREGELMCSVCGDFLPVEMDSSFRLRRSAAHRSFLILFEFGGDIHRVKVREGRQLVIGRDMETSNDQALAELCVPAACCALCQGWLVVAG